MARLYVIRHGKPSATWGGDDDDPGLDETGRAQALALDRELASVHVTLGMLYTETTRNDLADYYRGNHPQTDRLRRPAGQR